MQPLLKDTAMIFDTENKPPRSFLLSAYQHIVIQLVPASYHSSSSGPVSLILLSGHCIKVVWEDLDIRPFSLCYHRQPSVSCFLTCCHIVTFCWLCLHTLLRPPFFLQNILHSGQWELASQLFCCVARCCSGSGQLTFIVYTDNDESVNVYSNYSVGNKATDGIVWWVMEYT